MDASGLVSGASSAVGWAGNTIGQLMALGIWPFLSLVFFFLLFIAAVIPKGGLLVKVILFIAALLCLGKALGLF